MRQLRRQFLCEEVGKGVLFRSDLNQDQVIEPGIDIAADCFEVMIG